MSCDVCGAECEKSGETQIGGDINSNGNLSGVADCPTVVWCDDCGAAYFEDERDERHDLQEQFYKDLRNKILKKKRIEDENGVTWESWEAHFLRWQKSNED